MVGRRGEASDRAGHRNPRRLVDVHAVDDLGANLFNGDRNGLLVNDGSQPLAVFWKQLFGIAQSANACIWGKNNGGSYDRAKERSTAHFVDAGDYRRALRPRLPLIPVAAD